MNHILLDILVVLVAAKVAAELAERMGIPAVVGEILAGLAIGPSALGLVEASDVLRTLGELGVIMLLLQVGLEMDLADLGSVGRASLVVAGIGVVLPFVMGAGFVGLLDEPAKTAVFVGAALTATSVGITARVFGDLRALASVEARTVLGAAVADDVLGLLILTVVVRVATGADVTAASVVWIALVAVGFLVFTAAVGGRLAPPLFAAVQRVARSPGTLLALGLAFTLGVAELASAAKLAPIVGAFVAGLALARSDQAERIRRDLTPLGHVFVPVFFLQIGIDADVEAMVRPSVLGVAGLLLVAAVIGKVAAAVGAERGDRLLVGLGMLPRGEVGLIFAGIGLREGVLDADLYAALLLVVLVTTVVTPPLLSWRLRRVRAPVAAAAGPAVAPAEGWLVTADGVVELTAEPPPHLALSLGLAAAAEMAHARPGPGLLGWLGQAAALPVQWDRHATESLFAVLSRGSARSWGFLEVTGLLERALPELAEAVRRRRADPFELDPTHALRFGLVDDVHRVLAEFPVALESPELVVMAALLIECEATVPTARKVVQRLQLGAAAEQEVALLVAEHGLLRAAAVRPEGLSETSVLPIAAHLDRPERARALYVLSVALGGLEPWERQRLDELHRLVQDVLAHPELAGREARNLVESRRARALRLTSAPTTAERLEAAPQLWLVAHEPAALAQQAELVDPLVPRGRVRVAVVELSGMDESRARVDVASRDQPGLLASIAAGLTAAGLDVVEASAATWTDGGTLDSFVVRAGELPREADLAAAIEEALRIPAAAEGVPDARVGFDDAASPWYTLCSVDAADRPGLLRSLTAAFAAAGVDVHAARIVTESGVARDRFELTDRRGAKLDDAAKDAVRAAIAHGVRPARKRPWSRRRARTKLPRTRNIRVTDEKPRPLTVAVDDLP